MDCDVNVLVFGWYINCFCVLLYHHQHHHVYYAHNYTFKPSHTLSIQTSNSFTMRYTTALLALAASASAAVLPRSQLGSWDVKVAKSAYANGYQTETATAVYTSDSYPEGVSKKCTFVSDPRVAGEKAGLTCDEGFTYSFDGQSEFA